LPALGRKRTAKGREILPFQALLLADWTGLNAVEAEILKSDEASLIETPVVDIFYHLFLFFCCAFCKLRPKTDGATNAVRLAISQALHVICFSFFVQRTSGAILNTGIAIRAEPLRDGRI
jgi:hypothetical protein